MSLRINTNTAALNAYGNLQANQAKQQNAFEKLSSGLRINRAADDAAGLSISQGLTSQINGLTQATRNAQDGINVAQIADGALSTVQTILQRQRDLTVQAANGGSMDANARDAISAEIGKLNEQINNINQTTAFGGTRLFNDNAEVTGAARNADYQGKFQVGANGTTSEQITLTLGAFDAKTLGTQATTTGATAGTPAGPGPDGIAGNADDVAAVPGAPGTTTGGVDVSTTELAQASIATIDKAIQDVSEKRSDIGATQNQLSYTMTNLQTTIQNVSASRSNITDADLATEVSNMSQAQILTQAATSVLAQANSAPQAILKLLQ